MRPHTRDGISLTYLFLAGVLMSTAPAFAQQTPEEAAGGGQLVRKEEKPINLCAGCISTLFSEGSKGGITPYGRIELDGIYSSRNTNPLDPSQFNGYATAAGRANNRSSTLNPRYSVFGIRGDRTDGVHSLSGVVEADFYGQTDNAGNLPPRLRLAYLKYSPNNNKTSITIGQDWNPIMGLLPDLIDFSIMGYGGNLWNRLPQVTLRHKFDDHWEGLLTAMRFERGLSQCCGQVQVRPNTVIAGGGPTNVTAFNDPVQVPYFGTRLAYNGTGSLKGTMLAANVAYRYYRSAPVPANPAFQSGKDINSYVIGLEGVHQITPRLKFMGELAWGQALGVEWFRFNQELNLVNGNSVRTLTGWAQLSYAYSRDYTFLAGWGFDNPLNSDLKGSITVQNSNVQYLDNQRTFLTAIHPIWADFYTGFEWTHLWTSWAGPSPNQSYQADQFMLSAWYNF